MSTQENRFSHSLPGYVAPTQNNHGVLQAPKRNSTPALSLTEQKQNKKVEQLLAEAKVLSGQLVEDVKQMQQPKPVLQPKKGQVRFCQAHIVSDLEFIKLTRGMCIHDKGAMQLLLANGGSEFLEQGFLPAQAFDMLRKQKMSKMVKKPNRSFDRRPTLIGGKVYVPGLPQLSVGQRAAKIGLRLIENKGE